MGKVNAALNLILTSKNYTFLYVDIMGTNVQKVCLNAALIW